MIDLNSVIGLEEKVAKKFLEKNGYNNIQSINNSKHVEGCDDLIVCGVRKNEESITLICGEFQLKLKEQ